MAIFLDPEIGRFHSGQTSSTLWFNIAMHCWILSLPGVNNNVEFASQGLFRFFSHKFLQMYACSLAKNVWLVDTRPRDMALEDGCKSSSCVDLTRRMKNLIQRMSFEVHVLCVCRWIGIIPAGFAFYITLRLYGEWVTDTTSLSLHCR